MKTNLAALRTALCSQSGVSEWHFEFIPQPVDPHYEILLLALRVAFIFPPKSVLAAVHK